MMSLSIDELIAGHITSTVMIVDDQSTSLNILSETVRNIDPDITVKAFSNPAAALLATESTLPDLIITDYKMPEMDGLEVLEKIASANKLNVVLGEKGLADRVVNLL